MDVDSGILSTVSIFIGSYAPCLRHVEKVVFWYDIKIKVIGINESHKTILKMFSTSERNAIVIPQVDGNVLYNTRY